MLHKEEGEGKTIHPEEGRRKRKREEKKKRGEERRQFHNREFTAASRSKGERKKTEGVEFY